MKTTWFILSFLMCLVFSVDAQPVQTVRGMVTDRDTKAQLTGVTVILTDSDPVIGTSTNVDGEFTHSVAERTDKPDGREEIQPGESACIPIGS